MTASAPGHAGLQLWMRKGFIWTQRMHEESTADRLRYQRETAIFSHSTGKKRRGKSWKTRGARAVPDRDRDGGKSSESILKITSFGLRSSECEHDPFPSGAFQPGGSQRITQR